MTQRAGDGASAEDALRRRIRADDRDADAHFRLANLLREQGRFTDAIASYRAALRGRPNHPSVQNNLGLALACAGDDDAAENAFRAALAREPGHRQALSNLVHLLCKRQRYREASAAADRYVRTHADPPATFWIDYGIARHAENDLDAAAECLRTAARLAPDDAIAHANLGSVLVDMGDFDAAERALDRARDVAPGDLNVMSLLVHCRAHLCRWDGLASLQKAIGEQLAADPQAGINPFHALVMPISAVVQRRNARKWAASIVAAPMTAPAIIGERGDRLRVGYVSSDFREHALAFLATEVWERHDRARFATFAYAISVPDDSPMRQRIRNAFAAFRDCSASSADEVARRIRADGIDVLVDLNGYTANAQSAIFAARPARVQIQWLGYLATMGAPWIDYIVTDRYATPASDQDEFDETFLYLPDCYCPSDTRRPVASTPRREACGLPEKAFVFCCFNNPYKLAPALFDGWMRLLLAVPGSILWLSPSNATAADNLVREASARGVAPSRLVFAPRVPIAEHLARHVHANLYLDTAPYNGGTSTNDALFMGVPVLTCSGETMASRIAGSQLRAIGLPSLVTDSRAGYEARALVLAGNPSELEAIRAELAANRAVYPLFDMARFTSALETALAAAAGGAVDREATPS